MSCKKEDLTQGQPKYTLDFTYAFQGSSGNSAPATVNFECISTDVVNYLWDFGDNSYSTLQSPTHTYLSEGSYVVSLTTSYPGGGSLSKSKTISVDAPAPLIASFICSSDTTALGQSIQFTNTSQGATSYFWDFGNGSTSTATNPSVSYSTAGFYTVILTASNSITQQSDVFSKNIFVQNVIFPGLTQVSIAQLINQYQGTQLQFGYGNKISGTVISDRINSNISSSRNLIIWDGTNGILVRAQSPHNFNMGDKVVINLNTAILLNYFGNLELDSVPISNIQGDGIGQNYPPTIKTIGQILPQPGAYISTLVRINNVTISGSSNILSGTLTLNDGTGTMNLFTRTNASFANSAYPTSTVSITGILTIYNGQPQLEIRNLSDIQ